MTAKIEQSPFAVPSVPVVAGGQQMLHASLRLQAHAFSAAMRYQIETLAFLKHRYEQDMKLMDDLAESVEFNDALDVVGTFVQNATAQYATEAGKIASIGSRLASETAKRLRNQAEATIGDMAAQTVA
ncbi:phasin family protein [Mesorhizobium sp. KR9-304]|uniref:phasin family protein n=1 Tax=Mesorhizobium sp. KR9-304 TaxID=3156614 RepID=UPI0032B3CCD2